MISVRGAENLEFANPSSTVGEASSTTQIPSFFAVQSLDVVDTESTEIVLGDKGSMHPHRYALNFGEQVMSLRTLLHRHSLYDVSSASSTGSTRASAWVKSFTRLPPSYGYDPAGLSQATKILAGAGQTGFNFCPTPPITLVAGMYAAFRGSVNYVSNVSQDLAPYIGDVRVQRITDDTYAAYRRGLVISNTNIGTSNSAYNSWLNFSNGTNAFGTAGAAFTNSQTNGAISWNQPQMSGVNFNYTDPTYSIAGNSSDQTDKECSIMQVLMKQNASNTTVDFLSVATFAGSGPDFQCLWFLCCPTLDYYNATPTAV